MLGVGLMAAKTDSAVQRPKDNYIHLRIPKAECQADMFRPMGSHPQQILVEHSTAFMTHRTPL